MTVPERCEHRDADGLLAEADQIEIVTAMAVVGLSGALEVAYAGRVVEINGVVQVDVVAEVAGERNEGIEDIRLRAHGRVNVGADGRLDARAIGRGDVIPNLAQWSAEQARISQQQEEERAEDHCVTRHYH